MGLFFYLSILICRPVFEQDKEYRQGAEEKDLEYPRLPED